MTAVDTRRPVPSLGAQLRSAALLTWRELVRVAAASALWMLTLVPVAVASTTGRWWLVSLSAVPVALLSTGMAALSARIAGGDRARVRDILAVDPVLALALVALGTVAGLLVEEGGWMQLLGFVSAAACLVVAPLALAYGAVRGRRGVAALRGGVILAIYRPSVAVTVLAVACIGGFAVVASIGTLGLVVPAIVSTFAAIASARLLDVIDTGQGGAR